jgi:ABC-type multidrug transport system fused ATPase/permease subunit
MISVERIGEYIDEQKVKSETKKKTDSSVNILKWPKSGKIEFRNVYFKYSDNDRQNVLENASIVFNDGEHIGIIGITLIKLY